MLSGERVERYELLGELATGGMATVYLGRQRGPFGFSRTVAIKSMHPQYAKDDGFRAMFLDEATLTSKIRHPNVVPTLDIVCAETKVLLVMEYIDGASLSTLLRASGTRKIPIAPAVAVAIVCDVLHGLHAAHELADDDGRPLAVVHRDVSPQNVHVGVDGLARVLDFGVAKAASRRYVTQGGEVKGKLAYMSPEQLCGEVVDRRADIYAAGVVLWETLTCRRLFDATNDGDLVRRVIEGKIDPPSFLADEPLTDALDRVVLKALSPKPDDRWSTADEMAHALAEALTPAPRSALTTFVKQLAGAELDSRAHRLREGGTPISRELEPEAKALLNILTEHATVTSVPFAMRRERPDASDSGQALPAAPPQRSRALAIVGSVLALAALTGGAFAIGSRSARRPVGSDRAPATSSVPSSELQTGSSAIASAETPPPVSSPSSPPPREVTTTTGATSARPRTPPRKPSTAPATSHPRTGPDCRVPYTIDAQGDKHYRAECVE